MIQVAAGSPRQAQAPLVFYYPSRVVGGAEWLLIRVARALADTGREVAVVDWEDGFLAAQLAGTNVRHLVQRPGARTPLPKGCVVVGTVGYLYQAWRDLAFGPEDRIVLWALHPLASRALLPPVPLQPLARLGGAELVDWGRRFAAPHDFWLARRTLGFLQDAGALLVMDEDNRVGIERALRMRIDEPLFVPVVVPRSLRQARPRTGTGPLRIGWLGRLSGSKVTMLVHGLQDFARHVQATGDRLEITVVGDGEERARLERALPPGLSVRLAGTLLGDALEDWIERDVDLLFACGTSCLEAAKMGVPAVLVDECSDAALLAGYRYRWLHEATGFSLAVAIAPGNVPHHPHTMNELLRAVSSEEGWREQSERARGYFESHHALEGALPAIAQALDDSRATIGRLAAAGLYREGLARRAVHALRRLAGRSAA